MRRMVVSLRTKADAERTHRTARETGRIEKWVIVRVLTEPAQVYRRWEFEVEVAE